MSEVKPVLTTNERVLNQYGRDTHLASDAVYIKEYANEVAELRAALEALQVENAKLKEQLNSAAQIIEQSRVFEKELVEENAEQAKRIVFLKDVIALNHDWHEQYDDYDGYKDSTLCNMNTKALEAQKGTE